ncbi:MAG TPA: LysR family transcriptional regulator [Dehalococcoidia bacterium]|nr:LysR family transcriptional regulator [Dehalococcoidia bacterium]
MELHQLRYLRAVVRAGSVTRAAEAEHVAQPSISKQIRVLERELGTPLFHRVGRRVLPTDAGLLLAEAAERVLDDLAATASAIAGLRTSPAGSLRVCATETVTDNILPPALAALCQTSPRARISVEMLGTDDALRRILADEADLAIVVLPLADSRLAIRPLFDEEIVLALPPDHALAAGAAVPLDTALSEPGLLLSMPGHGLRAQLEREAQVLGLGLESAIELRSQHALLQLVARGAGVCFAPVSSTLEFRSLLAVRPLLPALQRRIGWAARRGRHLSPLALAFIEQVKQAAGGALGPHPRPLSQSWARGDGWLGTPIG